MASRLEQLNRIAVGIFNLNLFAARAYLHFISKNADPPPSGQRCVQANPAPEEHTVPSAGLLLTAIGHWSGPSCPGPLKINLVDGWR